MFRVLKIMDQFAFACMFMSCFLANWLRTGIIFRSWIIIYFFWNGRFLLLKYTSYQPKQVNFSFDWKQSWYIYLDYKELKYDSSNMIFSITKRFSLVATKFAYLRFALKVCYMCFELFSCLLGNNTFMQDSHTY